ncbi:MAG: glycoside hydrolase family 68 protein, partial [Bdellovibrionales bacterium]|nr:glycoside hydrolase family 68 protein [Bdellovibrionales bacterium]
MVVVHPERFVWDSWYVYDKDTRIFHVFYLNAERSPPGTEQHHENAMVGYGKTMDFRSIDFVNDAVLAARFNEWDNTSIWTSDTIQVAGGAALKFYTSRTAELDDGLTQQIGLAYSFDYEHWTRVPAFRVTTDATHFEPRSVFGEQSPHAWRDPFLFMDQGRPYMLLAAKSKHEPIHRKGAIALLRATSADSLADWEVVGEGYHSGTCGEIEVPQLYINSEDEYELLYSCHPQYDFGTATNGYGGFQAVKLGKVEEGIEALFAKQERHEAVVLLREGPTYACRVIPELHGLIVGFDIDSKVDGRKIGGFVNTGLYLPFLESCDRDFSAFSIPGGEQPS